MRTLKIIWIAILCLLVALPLFGQEQRVQATGAGMITYGDVAAGRDRAIDDALRKAVEQTLGTYVDSKTTVENYMVVEDRILNWSRGYVKNYDIVSEGKKNDDMYEVNMMATVDMANLSADANAVKNLIFSMGNPRVMFMIDEQNVGQAGDRYGYFTVNMTATENAMINKFMEKGFDVVDPSTVRQNKERDSILAAINGDSKAAAAIAASVDAEVVVTGKAIAKIATGINLGGIKSGQANINVRVIDADVGSIIATGSKHAAHPHIDEITAGTMAIEKASNTLADELVEKILEKWRSKFYDLNTLKLIVTGMQNYTEASNFKNSLQFSVRGLKSAFQRNVGGGMAEYDIKITGNAEQLARELDQRDLGSYKLAVVGVTANKVTVKAVQAAPENMNQ